MPATRAVERTGFAGAWKAQAGDLGSPKANIIGKSALPRCGREAYISTLDGGATPRRDLFFFDRSAGHAMVRANGSWPG
jgi:hypothetical protein